MTIEHKCTMSRLARRLILQLDEREYDVRMDGPRLRVSSGNFFLPDVGVIPRAFAERNRRERASELQVYEESLTQGGGARPAALPAVRIELAPLFD